MKEKTMTNEMKKPVFKHKVGVVNVSLFENRSDRGPWYSLTLDRVYKRGDEFKRTSSFPEQELENVKLAVERACEYIAQRRG
jgi:hypothetical protein